VQTYVFVGKSEGGEFVARNAELVIEARGGPLSRTLGGPSVTVADRYGSIGFSCLGLLSTASSASSMVSQARLTAARLAREGDLPGDEVRVLLADPASLALNVAATAAAVAVLVLMIWQPGG
jgi:hypothetical protein